MKTIRLILLLTCCIYSTAAFAQEHHSRADIFLEFSHYQPQMKIGLYIELEPGWHTYWINPGQTGMGPTFSIDKGQTSEIIAPTPSRFSTPTAESFAFEHEVLFYRTLTLDTGPPHTLQIQADWLVCKDICIPNSKKFTVTLATQVASTSPDPIFTNFVYPAQNPNFEAFLDPSTNTLYIDNIKQDSPIDVFPADPMQFEYIKARNQSHHDQRLQLDFDGLFSSAPVRFLVAFYDQQKRATKSFWVSAQQKPLPDHATTAPTAPQPMLIVLLLALVGGLLLNLMPCVFPVVSIKFFHIADLGAYDQKKFLRSNLIYSLGVICSFIALAFTLVFLRSLGHQLGWGFQLQSPLTVALMTLLFYVIGLNFLGVFEVSQAPLPTWIQRKIHSTGHVGDFFTGVFTTLVATPCTAPFMAASIGYALAQNMWIVFSTFLMLGVGLSLPYILIGFFPKIASKMPKPGVWMNTMKEILAFPMFFTSAWLIWVYSKLATHTALLSLLLCLVLIAAAFCSIRWSKKKWIRFLLFLAALSMALMPALQSATTINWIDFSPQTIQNLQQKQHWIFVDFTADWCLTCKANEALTIQNKRVLKAIDDHNIQMVKADWTQKDATISQELEKYARVGVPFYLLYMPNQEQPLILPTILTPRIFLDALEDSP